MAVAIRGGRLAGIATHNRKPWLIDDKPGIKAGLRHVSRQQHDLEALTHFARQSQSLDLLGQSIAGDSSAPSLACAKSAAAIRRQSGIAPARHSRPRANPAWLPASASAVKSTNAVTSCKPRQDQRIGVGAMPVVADQGAVVALGQIVLGARIAVVDEQHEPGFERAEHGLHPVRQLRQDLGAIALGEFAPEIALDMAHGPGDERIGRSIAAPETGRPRSSVTCSSKTSPSRLQKRVAGNASMTSLANSTPCQVASGGRSSHSTRANRAARQGVHAGARAGVRAGRRSARGCDSDAAAHRLRQRRARPLRQMRRCRHPVRKIRHPAPNSRRQGISASATLCANSEPSSGAVTKSPAAPNLVRPAL